MFCRTLLYVHSSIAIILMGKRELVALLNLSSWCLLMVGRLFLAVPWGCLRFVIVVFPDHTHLQFIIYISHHHLLSTKYIDVKKSNLASFKLAHIYFHRVNSDNAKIVHSRHRTYVRACSSQLSCLNSCKQIHVQSLKSVPELNDTPMHSKKGGKDLETIQSSTIPDPGCHMGK